MEAGTAAAKPKGRRRPAKKQAEAAAPPASAAAPPVSAAAAGTLEHTEQHEEEDAGGPRPSLSQRVAKSLRQLTSQLGAGSKTEVHQAALHGV